MHNLSPAELARELDDYHGVGSGWIRFDINWSLIQRGGPSSYEWEPFDRVVRAATARGLKVLVGVLYTPEWARPGTSDSTYAPFDLAAYANFCREAATHYAPMGVHHWEIWNEPNIGFWKPEPDPARYAAMLKLAYPAIKQADPDSFVITGGLSPFGGYGDVRPGHMNPLTFLERMYQAGAAGSFDALGWHPYEFAGFGFHPMSAWSQLSATTPSVRSLMLAHGDGQKQVWGTEYGVPTGGSGAVSETAQADMVTGAYERWRSWEWTGPLFWFSYRNAGWNPGEREHNFGLVRADFSHKPAYVAYRRVAGGA